VRGMGNGSWTELPGDIDVQTHSSDRGCLYSLNRAWLGCRSLRIGQWEMIGLDNDHLHAACVARRGDEPEPGKQIELAVDRHVPHAGPSTHSRMV